jgi:hypothetical protein
MPSLISHVEVIQPFEVIPTAEFRHPLTSKWKWNVFCYKHPVS